MNLDVIISSKEILTPKSQKVNVTKIFKKMKKRRRRNWYEIQTMITIIATGKIISQGNVC